MFGRVARGVIAVQVAMLAMVSAHPGPVGHTHDDEWPFGAVAFGVVLFVAIGCVASRIFFKEFRAQRAVAHLKRGEG